MTKTYSTNLTLKYWNRDLIKYWLLNYYKYLHLKLMNNQKKKSFFLLFLIILILVLELWIFKPRNNTFWEILGFIILGFLCFQAFQISKPVWANLKTSKTSLPSSYGMILITTFFCMALLLLLGFISDNLYFHFASLKGKHLPPKILRLLFLTIPGVLAQQFGLYFILFPLTFILLKKKWAAILLTGSLFSLIHAPNPVLTAVTLIGGLTWTSFYIRYRRFTPLILSHFLMAATLYWGFPNDVHLNFRVGLKAWNQMRQLEKIERNGLWNQVKAFSSNEYFETKGGTRALFIQGLYEDVHKRTPDQEEVNQWVDGLHSQTRREVVIKFFTSPEYQDKIVKVY